jgi:magnesium-transporting ATPase (P-type)
MACVSSISGFVSEEGFLGWIQGVSIIIGLILLVGISYGTEYFKDIQLRILDLWDKNDKITVIRGKRGTTQTIRIDELVVGDVIKLEPGTKIPAQCLLIEGNNVQVYEPPSPSRSGGL